MRRIPFRFGRLRNKKSDGSWDLGTRLALSMFVLFAIIFGVSVISHFEKLNNQKDSRVDSMRQTERTIVALLNGFVADLESFSLSTTITMGEVNLPIEADAMEPELQASTNAYLQRLFDSYEVLQSIFVTDPEGRVVYSNSGDNIGRNLSDRSYVQALQQGTETFWSEGFPGLETGRTIIAHGRQILTPEGETLGFLIFAFYPESLAMRLPPNIAGEGHISLFDQQGQLLLRVPADGDGLPPVGTFTNREELGAARAGEDVVLRSSEAPLTPGDNYAVIGGMDQVDWVVSYSLPSSAIEGGANAIFQRDLLILAGLMISGLAAALYLGNRVDLPLSRLGGAALAIARGDPAGDLDEIETTEVNLAALASTMRQMRESIRQREEQLNLQTALLESIEQTGEELASELDVEKTVNTIIDACVDLTSAQASLFLYRRDPELPFEPVGHGGQLQDLPISSPTVQAVLRGQTVHLSNVETTNPGDPDAGVHPAQPRSILGVPIRSRDGLLMGALVLTHSATDAFSLQDLRVARGLARWAGIVLENAELYRRCQEVLELLQKANDDKDEFLAMVSHELRTPVTTIYGGSRLLRRRLHALTPEAVDDMIGAVADEAEQLYRLVEDLLALARTESSAPVEREPVSTCHLLEGLVAQYGRGHSRLIQLDVPEDFPPVLAEQTYLIQIVSNLISNADKYSPEGMPVEINATHDSLRATISVSDHGPGVPEDELELIFERFYRSPTSSTTPGKGLGLTVCRRLAKAIQGQVEARNRPGGGLQVSLTLELAEQVVDLEDPERVDNVPVAQLESRKSEGGTHV